MLGAGLQGACAAFALAERGWSVRIVDQAHRPLSRASRRNEGKIHLGMTYANDASFATQALMLRCGLAFGGLVERWCGAVDWSSMRSAPFDYVVMRDSMVAVDRLAATYARLAAAFDEIRREVTYLGQRLDWLVEAPAPLPPNGAVNTCAASHSARTAERALDLPAFCDLVSRRLLAHPAIAFQPGRRVESVERLPSGLAARGPTTGAAGQWEERGDIVVNCLWEDRRRLDVAFGLPAGPTHLLRLKYRVIARLPPMAAMLPSYTLVLGRYGDLVINQSGRHYLSWYPDCMIDASAALAVPRGWQAAIADPLAPDDALALGNRVIAGLGSVLPFVRPAAIEHVDAGVVCARGESDIDDPGSALHRRADVGVAAHDGYFSIDTGKLTCAPAFAADLARAVEGG